MVGVCTNCDIFFKIGFFVQKSRGGILCGGGQKSILRGERALTSAMGLNQAI